MNAHGPSAERGDFASDVKNSRRLQRRLRFQVMGGILATALTIGSLASLYFFHSRQQSILDHLQLDLQTGVLALGTLLHEYQSVALQVTSRSYSRDLLARYNAGDLTYDQLRAESMPELTDAIRLSPSILGIRRFDADGRLVVEVGAVQDTQPSAGPDDFAPTLGVPRISPRQARLAISAPISTRNAARVGIDVVDFDIGAAYPIVERLQWQFGFPLQIAFVTAEGSTFRLAPGSDGRRADALTGPRLEDIAGAKISVDPGIHSLDEHTLVITPVPNSDWRMAFLARTDAITGNLRTDSLFLFAAILLLSLAGMLITSRLVKPTVGKILIGERQLERLYRQNRHLVEKTLKDSRLLDEVLNGTPSVIFVKDREGRYILVNQAYCDERQMTREQIIGKTDFDFHSAETAEAVRNNDLLAIEKGSPVVIEEQLVIDNETRTFLTTKLPLRDQDDRIYATCGLATDITEIKKNEELRFALEKAEAANYAKTAFLANMSHELRTPLHGILSYADLGSKRSESLERKKLGRYFDNIQQSGRRLLDLLNDLLDLSKLEAGKYELVYRKVAPGQVLDECLVELEPMINARRLAVELPAAALDYIFEGDLEKFRQVMRNLLGNAIKFSPPGGRIDIEFDDCHLQVGDLHVPGFEVRLTDDGEGIAAGELNKIFDKFYQSGKTRAGGTGLGLSICREIVLLHHGEIRAENVAGRGARFVVRLPRNNPFAAISEMRVV